MIYGGLFDLDSKLIRKEELESIINGIDFWNSDNRESILKESNSINEIIKASNLDIDIFIKIMRYLYNYCFGN